MLNRDKFTEIIEEFSTIGEHHKEFGVDVSVNRIKNITESFDIKLMVVGHFNAGKSSLLNGLLGRPNFLKEAQLPQTAIATELIYDDVESAFAYTVDGKGECVSEDGCYVPDKYDHLVYRVAEPVLKQIGAFTIVDTPGFDAGIEAHTKALANYIGIGSAYLLVVDQEKGGIDQTTLDFIAEISHYSKQIAILINKCDKITVETANSIVESAKRTLLSYGFTYNVYTVSARDNDIASKLVSIISKFNAQLAFDKVVKKQILDELISSEKTLELARRKMFLDTYDIDEEIAAYNRTQEQMASTFERKRKEAEMDLDKTVEQVASEAKSALVLRAEAVAEAILSGNQAAAEAIIVETIRPIMLASMRDISCRQIDSIASALDFSGIVGESENIALSDIVVNIAGNLKNLIDQGAFGAKDIHEVEKREHKKDVYHAVAGIAALVTEVVAPWMEIVIILLPDIINLLKGIFGESQTDVAKHRYVNNVVPQIINRLYPQIKQNIETSTCQVLNEYQKLLDEKIEFIKNGILKAENKRRKKIESFEMYKRQITDDIASIQSLIQKVR